MRSCATIPFREGASPLPISSRADSQKGSQKSAQNKCELLVGREELEDGQLRQIKPKNTGCYDYTFNVKNGNTSKSQSKPHSIGIGN